MGSRMGSIVHRAIAYAHWGQSATKEKWQPKVSQGKALGLEIQLIHP